MPIVFLGPSLPHDEASKILEADFRPPIRRGDLDGIAAGTVVAIIDGVFNETLAISPSEIREAALHGVRLLGSSSMGALRAAEVREMEGVGRIHAMFEQEIIDSDDEVALVFDPETLRPLSEPLVNIRHAVERLRNPGTIDDAMAAKILESAKRLFYPERTYHRILEEVGIADRTVVKQLSAMLRTYDLKREDAVTLLERVSREKRGAPRKSSTTPAPFVSMRHAPDALGEVQAAQTMSASSPVYLWEYGEKTDFRSLVQFLKLDGAFVEHARRAVLRLASTDTDLEVPSEDAEAVSIEEVNAAVDWQRFQWGWWAAEEARVTLRDFGLGFEDLIISIDEEVATMRKLKAIARAEGEDFMRALRAELFLSPDLALKRHAIRYGSLVLLAERARAAGPASPSEIDAARNVIAERVDARDWSLTRKALAEWGVSPAECDDYAERLALARREGGAVLRDMFAPKPRDVVVAPEWSLDASDPARVLVSESPKIEGDPRFCLPFATALEVTQKLRDVIGVTRVADVTKLSAVGLPNVQAYRPDGRFSTTIGSGKSLSVDGARVGALMEETEKWAQEQYDDGADADVVASYAELARDREVVDPSLLDLPHDSSYHPELPIGWKRCHDLVTDRIVFLPFAALTAKRLPDDIFYSPRLALKLFSSNGLASGFTIAEALTHALSEVIERHATKLAELQLDNPGGVRADHAFVDLATLPASCRRVVERVRAAGERIQLLHITSEVAVPSFWAMIFSHRDDGYGRFALQYRRASGYGTHPDPEVAANKALLEACQTEIVNIAGGREDLTLKSRSLGRHERTRAHSREGRALLFGAKQDPPTIPFSAVRGQPSRDARDDVKEIVERLRAAGVGHVLAVSYGVPSIAPAEVVRVVIPGLDTINPLHTGLRPRVSLLRDLLPPPIPSSSR